MHLKYIAVIRTYQLRPAMLSYKISITKTQLN